MINRENAGWISVKDKLPEQIYDKHDDDDGTTWTESDPILMYAGGKVYIGIRIVQGDNVYWDDGTGELLDVTYWMPLPSTEGLDDVLDCDG